MADPAQIDLVAERRMKFVEQFSFLFRDFAGCAVKMQVRPERDTESAFPYIDAASGAGIDVLYAGTATISAHVTAGRLTTEIYEITNPYTGAAFQPTDSVLLSQIGASISAATIAAFPFPGERGDDLVTWYDIVLIPVTVSGNNEILMRGTFTVRPGVTIP